MLKYSPGGSHTTIACFKEVKSQRTESEKQTDSARFVAAMMPKLPTFHTRAMKQSFKRKVQNLASIQPSVLDFLYKEIGWDASVADNPEMYQRLQLIFSGECGIVADLRTLNPGRPGDKYETFFQHLETVVTSVTAEDERRHNVAHMSQWLSVKDLVAQAAALCPPDTPIPSNALVRLQFTPRNPYSHAAMSFTSRYKVQYKIQRRQLRVSHPDDHYCAALLRYIKSLSVTLGHVACQLYFCDDKAKVPIGEPNVALSTGVRGKMCLAPAATTVSAADHDVHHKGSLTPSVLLQCDTPGSVDKSFVRGHVTVFINDSVFQSSNPFRHAVQLINTIRQSGDVPAVLLKFSDGGTDHRNTLESVKCALICVFLELDLDFLVAGRCAPGQSWTNPAERVMSILNIGLQNCSLSRCRADDEVEQSLKRCGGMDDIRAAAESKPMIKSAWAGSIEPIQAVIQSRFERLALKENGIKTMQPVEDDAIAQLKQHLLTLFPSLDLTKLLKANLSKNEAYQLWLEKHCRQRLYCFQIRKCDDETCCTRKIERMKWLPDPMLTDPQSDHFQPFEALYGSETNENDRPSLKLKPAAASTKNTKTGVSSKTSEFGGTHSLSSLSALKPKAGSSSCLLYDRVLLADAGMYTAQNARCVVDCVECRKPRVVYASSGAWCTRYKLEMAILLSENDYTCGAPLTPPGHVLHGKIYSRLEMTCESYIELSYYSSSNEIGKKPGLCCYCAADNTQRDSALLSQYKTVLPICDGCRIAGYDAVCLRPYGKKATDK
jgi:hypothetical protein